MINKLNKIGTLPAGAGLFTFGCPSTTPLFTFGSSSIAPAFSFGSFATSDSTVKYTPTSNDSLFRKPGFGGSPFYNKSQTDGKLNATLLPVRTSVYGASTGSGFNFGNSPSTSSGFNFGNSPSTRSAFSFGESPSTSSSSTGSGFSFGESPSTSSSSTVSGFSFSEPAPSSYERALSGSNFGGLPSTYNGSFSSRHDKLFDLRRYKTNTDIVDPETKSLHAFTFGHTTATSKPSFTFGTSSFSTSLVEPSSTIMGWDTTSTDPTPIYGALPDKSSTEPIKSAFGSYGSYFS
jgi:hypothetical protein